MKRRYDVTGMTCSACSAHVEKAVRAVPGAERVTVNLLANSMTVEGTCAPEAVIAAVRRAGYGAAEAGSTPQKAQAAPDETKTMKIRLIWSFLLLIPLMYISMGHMLGLPLPGFLHGSANAVAFAFTQLLLTVLIMLINSKYYKNGFRALARRAPNMDTLIAIGSSAAFVYGVFAIYRIGYGLGHGQPEVVERYTMHLYFESAAMILALVTLGKYLESKCKKKTTDAISKLVDLGAKTALVERDGAEMEIPTKDVVVGDVVLVKPGQTIPVDGVLIEGTSSVDQSPLTGESIPVEKTAGDTVAAACINKNGFFKMRAQKVGSDTTLSQIIRLVEEASSSKAPISRLADKISGIFVPVVMAISLAAFFIWLLAGQTFEFAMSVGISVLVISCPCALGLATPVAIMVGTGKGAENGILIKSAESLEVLHNISAVVLDKTGTITGGRPVVTDVLPITDEEELLVAAASLEQASEHPLAEAILKKAEEAGLRPLGVTDFCATPGRGITGTIDGAVYYAGNAAYMQEQGVDCRGVEADAARLAAQGKTPLFFAKETGLLGLIAAMDVTKPTSKAAVQQFQSLGIEVTMLTGDNKQTARAIADQLQVDKVVAEVLPQDKEQQVRALQAGGQVTAVIGDGINDAPALAAADVGIAIGAGADIAIDSADIVLMSGDLQDAVTAVRLSKSVIRNIKMSLFWAFFYNCIGIPIAAGALYPVFHITLNPMFGAAAMSLSSMCVVLNALRLKRFRAEKIEVESEDHSMKKVMKVNGMHCGHCQATVEKALAAVEGVAAVKVDLKKKTATITLNGAPADEVLLKAVRDAGFEPVEIGEKKGLFG